jgi:hypothetical protein
MSLRREIREMAVGETRSIPREKHKPTVVRATCSSLKADECKEYAVQTIPEGVSVKRLS